MGILHCGGAPPGQHAGNGNDGFPPPTQPGATGYNGHLQKNNLKHKISFKMRILLTVHMQFDYEPRI